MSDLTFSEKKQLESLFGMATGYVLDFSDRTFQEFVYDSTKIDILSQEFRWASGSKANRLRAFWRKQPNRTVGKLILDLREYIQEFDPRNCDKKFLDNSLQIGDRLVHCTEPDNVTGDTVQPTSLQTNILDADFNSSHEASVLRKESALLLAMFDEMAVSSDPHRRGYLLQDLLNRVFSLHKIATIRAFTRNQGAEQIDGAFKFDGWHYIVECRWREKLADIRELDGLSGQVGRSGRQTMGLFLSINSWSPNVPNLLKQNGEKCIVLMEGYDLRCVLTQQLELNRLLHAKLTSLNIEAKPYVSAADILKLQLHAENNPN